jgi:hypothetical protein
MRWLARLAWIGFLLNLTLDPGGAFRITLMVLFGALILWDIGLGFRWWKAR